MKYQLSTYWSNFLRRLAIIVSIIVLIWVLFSGCSESKKAQKAFDYVNTHPDLLNKTVSNWMDINKVDTTPKVIVSPPKIIEVPTQKIVRDEAAIKSAIDTFKATLDTTKDCGEAAMDAFNLGYEQAENKYLSQKTKAECPPDTTKVYYLTHELNRWKDSAMEKSNLNNYQRGQLDSKNETIKQKDEKINILYLWVVGLSLIGVLSHVIRSYAGNWAGSVKKLFTK